MKQGEFPQVNFGVHSVRMWEIAFLKRGSSIRLKRENPRRRVWFFGGWRVEIAVRGYTLLLTRLLQQLLHLDVFLNLLRQIIGYKVLFSLDL
jgi:hypothetical protein